MANRDEQTPLLGKSRIEPRRSRVWIEPSLGFVVCAWYLSSSIIPNYLLRQTCIADGYDAKACAEIWKTNASHEIEEKIQPQVSLIIMTNSLLTNVVAGIVSLLMGPWSDTFGRKKIICANFFGYTFALVFLTLAALLAEAKVLTNPWFFVIPYVCIAATGGFPALLLSVYCYVNDISNENNRSYRITTVELTIFSGMIAGTALCSYAVKIFSAATLFSISTLLALAATTFVLIFIQESVESVKLLSLKDQFCELLSPTPLLAMFKAVFKSRVFHERKTLWLLIVILVIQRSNTVASAEVFYLFAREKFQWTLNEATIFESTSLLTAVVGSFVGLLVLKRLLKISDVLIAAFAVSSYTLDSILRAAADNKLEMYFASTIGLLKLLLPPMARSLLAKVVPKNEIGSILSFVSLAESAAGLVVTLLYFAVYNRTLTSFPGAFYFIATGFCVINLVLVSTVKNLMFTVRS